MHKEANRLEATAPRPRRRWRGRPALLVAACLAAMITITAALPARPAEAHLATWGSWITTKQNLDKLFPEASRYLTKKHTFTDAEVTQIEAKLGFALYPEDRNPNFYIAVKDLEGGKQLLLGVGLFIDPRVKPKIVGGQVVRLEVGIGVDKKGRITRVALYDYNGNQALAGDAFLNQLRNRSLANSFKIDKKGVPHIAPVAGEEAESQLIANAAFEALYLMKIALGK